MADCETFSLRPHAVNEPVSAIVCRISSWRKSMERILLLSLNRNHETVEKPLRAGPDRHRRRGDPRVRGARATARRCGRSATASSSWCKMLIAPIVFSTVVVGIAQMGAMKDVGRIGLRALVYFEVVSTLALVIGLVVVNVLQPGGGIDDRSGDARRRARSRPTPPPRRQLTTTDFLLNIIPNTVVDAFARGEILQVLLFSVLFGLALLPLGERVRAAGRLHRSAARTRCSRSSGSSCASRRSARSARWPSPSARYGVGTLLSLGKLMAGVYVTCLLFVVRRPRRRSPRVDRLQPVAGSCATSARRS